MNLGHLNVGRNPFKDEGGRSLGRALNDAGSLKSFIVDTVQFEVPVLRQSEVNMRGLGISRIDCVVFSHFLEQTKVLTLAANSLSPSDVAEALKCAKQIQSLDLSDIRFATGSNENMQQKFSEFVSEINQKGRTLNTLKLGGNGCLGEPILHQLAKLEFLSAGSGGKAHQLCTMDLNGYEIGEWVQSQVTVYKLEAEAGTENKVPKPNGKVDVCTFRYQSGYQALMKKMGFQSVIVGGGGILDSSAWECKNKKITLRPSPKNANEVKSKNQELLSSYRFHKDMRKWVKRT